MLLSCQLQFVKFLSNLQHIPVFLVIFFCRETREKETERYSARERVRRSARVHVRQTEKQRTCLSISLFLLSTSKQRNSEQEKQPNRQAGRERERGPQEERDHHSQRYQNPQNSL